MHIGKQKIALAPCCAAVSEGASCSHARAEIAVLIAARNAERTIGLAVRSALRSNLVTEVIVVSDGSTDATGQAAVAVAGDDGRLRVLTLPENVGLAEPRNRGISVVQADYIALLDASNKFLPWRIETLGAGGNWDLVADNVVFVSNPSLSIPPSILGVGSSPSFEPLFPRGVRAWEYIAA